jgi:dimethylargininase
LADAVVSTRQPISLELAWKQQDDYVLCLTRLLPAIKELPSSDDFPDCCFVKDTTVINGTALMMNIGHKLRQGEVKEMKEVIVTLPGINRIMDMKSINDCAHCNGGDILFTSPHLFVGLLE